MMDGWMYDGWMDEWIKSKSYLLDIQLIVTTVFVHDLQGSLLAYDNQENSRDSNPLYDG